MDALGWLFQRNHQEHDFGIDAQIELVTADGYLTGQLLAVQIKYGKSFFQENFARTEQPTSTIKAFALCHTDVWWPYGRSTPLVTKQCEFDAEKLDAFLERGFYGLNIMTDWLGLDGAAGGCWRVKR